MKLNRLQLTISGILLTLALILAIYFSRKPENLLPAPGKDSGHASIRELVAQSVDIQAAVQKQGNAVPAACPELWTRVADSAVEQFLNFTDHEKAAMKTCSDAVPFLAKHDPQHLDKLRTSCSTEDEEGSNAMQSNCALYFYLYKAGLVAWFNQNKALKDLATDELALVFFHEYNNLDGKRLELLSQLVIQLMKRVPSYSAVKANASIQLFQLMSDMNPARAEELFLTLAELKKQKPDDEQLLEMHFVALAMLNDQAKMNELTESYTKDHPSSATGYYIRSAYFWQTKDREKTIEVLKNAIALDPRNSRFMETRERVETAEPGASGVYNVNVNFDLLSE